MLSAVFWFALGAGVASIPQVRGAIYSTWAKWVQFRKRNGARKQ